jgi:two-component system capsular synthesis response regulator RcsB
MIRKVLIVEDHESVNISLQKTLNDLGIVDVDVVYYCDDALQKIERNQRASASYDLVITDLYFENDYRTQQITGGIALISAVKKIQPDLKVLVFSAEGKPAVMDMLFNTHEIDGYVRKARHDAKDLKTAITQISHNQRYIPRELTTVMRRQHSYHFTEYDITIISLLAEGVLQKNIPSYLQQSNIRPSGLSSVEKRLNHIRETLRLYKNEQLVVFCKDMGII